MRSSVSRAGCDHFLTFSLDATSSNLDLLIESDACFSSLPTATLDVAQWGA